MQPGSEIYWWRRVTGSIDFPYRGRVVKIGPSLVTVSVDDVGAGNKEVVRQVTRARVQLVGGHWTKSDEQGPSMLGPMSEWGKFTRYIEVGIDLRANRHVDSFENSYMLRYDRTHWVDSFGFLADARINRNRLTGPWGTSEEISAQEFQSIWTQAGNGSLWKQQLKASRSETMGEVPIWLARPGWRPPPLGQRKEVSP